MFKKISSFFNSVHDGIVKLGSIIEESKQNDFLEKCKSFKKFEDGIDCNVSESKFIAHVKFSYIFQSVSRRNDITGHAKSERYAVPVSNTAECIIPPLRDSRGFVISSPYTNSKGDQLRRGILFRNKNGHYFLIANPRDPMVITFRGNEFQAWAEDNLAYDEYRALMS